MNSESQISAAAESRKDRKAFGKALRESVPRSAHAAWTPPPNRADIVSLLEESNDDRIAKLIPLRYSRMLQSPLACLRGSAVVMARDSADLPTTNIRLQSCGDCHLQNFGWFASPERNLIFDVNDFDETRKAPWEWDIKRLVASVVVAAREKNASKSQQQQLAQATVSEYRAHLAKYAELAPLEMWYVRLDADALLTQTSNIASKKRSQQIIDAARQRTLDSLLPKMTERVNGELRFKDRPPLIFHPVDEDPFRQKIQEMMLQYRQTLSEDRRFLLDRYRLVDVAYKVVGVGSVGLRCGIILMLGPDDCPLVLQIKEARASVLEPIVGRSERSHHGHRIVHGQRVMQAASDIFLGWATSTEGRSYYFRQLRDMKMSVAVDIMSLSEFEEYVRLCGWALARAHAKAGDAAVITGYLGPSDQFDEALGEFGIAYADQVEQDFESLQNAAKSGRILVNCQPSLAGE
jgi:uncharacterized protein (DUF2252 family)